MLLNVEKRLKQRKLEPNHSDGGFIYKIIAHEGKNSKSGALLKYITFDYLSKKKFEFWSDLEHGNFLVLFKT